MKKAKRRPRDLRAKRYNPKNFKPSEAIQDISTTKWQYKPLSYSVHEMMANERDRLAKLEWEFLAQH